MRTLRGKDTDSAETMGIAGKRLSEKVFDQNKRYSRLGLRRATEYRASIKTICSSKTFQHRGGLAKKKLENRPLFVGRHIPYRPMRIIKTSQRPKQSSSLAFQDLRKLQPNIPPGLLTFKLACSLAIIAAMLTS